MKKIVYISLFVLLFASCNQDDAVVSGIAVAFYPETTAEVEEEDGVTYTIQLEATGSIGNQPASVEIMAQSGVEGTLLITDASGSPLEVNNNTFSVSFQQDTVESGNGPRVQALASFGVQALNDVIPTDYDVEFVIVGTGGAINSISSTNVFTLQVEDTDTAPIFEDDFENGLGNWTIIDLDGNNTWGETAFDGNTSALSSTFNSASPADEDNWLISPEINFDSFGSETLTFLSKTRFNDESNRLEVSVLQNFDGSDPLAAQQTLLNPTLDPHTGGGFGDFTESGDLDLSSISGSGRIAFRFKAVNASDGSGWEVDDVLLSIFDPDASGGGTDNLINLPYSEDFENCTQDFGTPNGFIEAFAAGAKTDRGWGCRQEGVDGSRGVRASGFGGDAGSEDAWLISERKFNLSAVTSANLSFDVSSEFSGDGQLRVYYTTTYLGGDPNNFSWTELSDVTSQLPAKGSETFTTVTANLAGAIGTNVFIAFRFDGATESNSASYEIDNVSVSEGSIGGANTLVADGFEGCSDQFGVPAGWIEEVVPGFKTNRGWGCRDDKARNGSYAVRASAFESGNTEIDNTYLIRATPIDFDAQTGETLTFWATSEFDGNGDLTFEYSNDYSGSGNPENATWTVVTINLPAKGSDTYTEVTADLSDITGSAYIAFHFNNAPADNSVSWDLDDFSIDIQ